MLPVDVLVPESGGLGEAPCSEQHWYMTMLPVAVLVPASGGSCSEQHWFMFVCISDNNKQHSIGMAKWKLWFICVLYLTNDIFEPCKSVNINMVAACDVFTKTTPLIIIKLGSLHFKCHINLFTPLPIKNFVNMNVVHQPHQLSKKFLGRESPTTANKR